MTVIQLHKKYYSFPTSWNELTARQAQQVMATLCTEYTPEQSLLVLLKQLSGCSWYRFLRASTKQKAEYLYLLNFLMSPDGYTVNHLPTYKGLIGPADNFDNLRMSEYVYADAHFISYETAEQKDRQDLYKMIAMLWRPLRSQYDHTVNAEGDHRELFSEVAAYERAKEVAKWPWHLQELCYRWYAGCRKQFTDDYADVFTGSGGEPALNGMISVMRAVAKDGTYGDFSKVEQMPVKLMMLELRENKHDVAIQEKEMKKQR